MEDVGNVVEINSVVVLEDVAGGGAVGAVAAEGDIGVRVLKGRDDGLGDVDTKCGGHCFFFKKFLFKLFKIIFKLFKGGKLGCRAEVIYDIYVYICMYICMYICVYMYVYMIYMCVYVYI